MFAPLPARAIVTALAAGQGLASLFIDLNRTHATNPLWPGHARFHLVWQSLTQTLVSAVVVALIWWPGPAASSRFYLAAVLTAIPMASFFLAFATRASYHGRLHDPNGIPPLRTHFGNRLIVIDGNTAIVCFASALLIAAVALF